MTTKLSTAPVTRETEIRYKGRTVVVTLSPATPVDVDKMQPARPEHLEFHLKGTQQRVYLKLESAFETARGAWREPVTRDVGITDTKWRKWVGELWDRFGSPDRHGYVDLMRFESFTEACDEVVKFVKHKSS